ncbi:Ada metal-binding domain-containing protein [Streptacidiphilus sp. P02-A3a]|uniref:Ada metal-binding domain-containing protein n=1 Tax=Streptacidiphilus sp. P02-A3a TaxID=2704468 RepID=UPI0015FCDCFD|nr:Ada metal-binding domain-containing protein [Streptacidiphilus sp. P02-A3a]QMU71564.1 cysteine methyltransferase [Streptacidiphilus sp. P02-A3a]
MSRSGGGHRPSTAWIEHALGGLPEADSPDFEVRVLRRVGVPRARYDTYLRVGLPTGGLYVASGGLGVSGTAPVAAFAAPAEFEELHRRRTGRPAIPAATPPPGLLTALRSGRTGRLPVDTTGLPQPQRAALDAVRSVPRGQLRPVAWVAREAGLADAGTVLAALAANPVPVLIPTHRITHDDGAPCDLGPFDGTGPALRAAEGLDMAGLADFSRAGLRLLGSGTTRIYCHPSCAHARRITPAHQVPFHSPAEARAAGYRPCRSCRPLCE